MGLPCFGNKEAKSKGHDEAKEYQADEHLLSLVEIASRFSAKLNIENVKISNGLDVQDAEHRLEEQGKNLLTPPKQTPEIVKFLKQFINFFMLLLEAASLLCLIAFLLDRSQKVNLYLAIVLIVIVIGTCIMAYVQERKSGALMESFKNLIPPKCTVVRGGNQLKILAENLVLGDLVYISSGDKIPADLRIIQCQDLKVDNSSLTGESEPQSRNAEQSNEKNPMEASNLAFFGTLAVDGSAYGIVMRTGDNTLLGQIASLTRGESQPTSLELEVVRFVRFISILAICMGIVFFVVGMIISSDNWINNIVNTIGVIVANVPEGLPATVTVCLTIAARRLAAKNVWVKQLESVETLGSTTMICSDKTGTLTQNRMTAVHAWYDNRIYGVKKLTMAVPGEELESNLLDPDSESCSKLLRVAAICSRAQFEVVDLREELKKSQLLSEKEKKKSENTIPLVDRAIVGDASETALLRMCESYLDTENYRGHYPKLFEIPFNSTNKFQLSIHALPDNEESVERESVEIRRSGDGNRRTAGGLDLSKERKSVDFRLVSPKDEQEEEDAPHIREPRKSLSESARKSVETIRKSLQLSRKSMEEKRAMEILAAERKSVDKLRKSQFTTDYRNQELAEISKNIDRTKANSKRMVAFKGAPEIVLGRCSSILIDGQPQPLTDEQKKAFQETVETLAAGGERILGFAQYVWEDSMNPSQYNNDSQNFPTTDYTFVGLVSLMDPPRPSVPQSIVRCKTAGIQIAMVTGDHPLTAKAIAKQIGLLSHPTKDELAKQRGVPESDIPEEEVLSAVVNGQMLREFTEDDWKRIVTKQELVFARTSPQQKLIIVSHFQEAGQIVAVTGDGVNDSPALKQANIGVAMGIAGSDVAKESADVILMDDNFSSITAGVEEGRVIFDNLSKSIMYTLAHLVPEVAPFLLNLALGLPVGLSTQLILCIDLGTELAPAISLAYELPESNIMDRPPRNSKTDRLVNWKNLLYSYIQIGFIEALAGLASYFYVMDYHGFPASKIWFKYDNFKKKGGDITINGKLFTEEQQLHALAEAQTAFFISIVFCQMANLIACKTRTLSVFQHGFRNKVLNWALLIEVAIMILIVFVPFLHTVFGSRPPPGFMWLIPLPFAVFIVLHTEFQKWINRVLNRRYRKKHPELFSIAEDEESGQVMNEIESSGTVQTHSSPKSVKISSDIKRSDNRKDAKVTFATETEGKTDSSDSEGTTP